jgi:hypothetical protein
MTQNHEYFLDPERNIQLSRNIASLSHELRDMYSLDFKIFGAENTKSEGQIERNKMIDQANAMFARILKTIEYWEENSQWWTTKELEVIRKIRFAAELHDPRKHRKQKA